MSPHSHNSANQMWLTLHSKARQQQEELGATAQLCSSCPVHSCDLPPLHCTTFHHSLLTSKGKSVQDNLPDGQWCCRTSGKQPGMAGIGTENDASLVNIKNSSEIIIFNSLPVKLNSHMPAVTFGPAGRIAVQLKEKPNTIKIEMKCVQQVQWNSTCSFQMFAVTHISKGSVNRANDASEYLRTSPASLKNKQG